MFSWSNFFTVLGVVGSIISIYEFIRARQPQPRRLAIICTIVFITMLAFSSIFSNILAPSENSGSSSSGASPASTVNDTQVGDTPTSTATPLPTDTPTSTATPLPTDTPTPAPPSAGTQLFPANGANWFNGWTGGDDWHISGNVMLNSGQSISTSIAPYHPGDNNVSDYAVDAQIQLNRFSDSMGSDNFGIIVRSPDGQRGYTFAICVSALTLASCGTNDNEIYISNGGQNIAENPYVPHANDWHTYRMEVRGNSVKVLIDGTVFLSATDNTYLSGGEVGLWSNRSQITIRSFTVIAL